MRSYLACFVLLVLVSPALSRNLEGSILDPDCNCDPGHHGGHKTPTPNNPVPTPSHGGGGFHPSPEPPTHSSPPYTPIVTPNIPTIPVAPVTPNIPTIPVAPVTPNIPTISVPPATPGIPTIPDPTSFPPFKPGGCSYWISHPNAIYAIFGYWGTIGHTFGAACGAAFGKNLSIHDALKNTRSDGIGALYREGTAALLNSLSCKSFPVTPQQVKDAFSASISSNKAAEDQALIFKRANEGGVAH